jgi:hypothetical protein
LPTKKPQAESYTRTGVFRIGYANRSKKEPTGEVELSSLSGFGSRRCVFGVVAGAHDGFFADDGLTVHDVATAARSGFDGCATARSGFNGFATARSGFDSFATASWFWGAASRFRSTAGRLRSTARSGGTTGTQLGEQSTTTSATVFDNRSRSGTATMGLQLGEQTATTMMASNSCVGANHRTTNQQGNSHNNAYYITIHKTLQNIRVTQLRILALINNAPILGQIL